LEQNLLSNAQGQGCSSHSHSISESVEGGMEMYESFLKSADTVYQPIKSDLEICLEEGVFLPENGL
jgi:hypothetical protein